MQVACKNKQQKKPFQGNEKVGEWHRNVETAYSSNGRATQLPLIKALNAATSRNGLTSKPNVVRCPTQGSIRLGLGIVGNRSRRSQQAMHFEDGRLLVHKDH
jgi:hypothetical protein